MGDRDILIELIKHNALVEPEGDPYKPRVILREPKVKDSEACVARLPKDALVINVDKFKSPGDIFNGSKGECKRADFVIISSEKKYILYIELKRTKDEHKGIVKQLKGAQSFIGYCREIGKNFWEKDDFLKGYKHRFVSIGHSRGAEKRRTRITRPASINDTPDKALKVDYPKKLEFNMLVGELT